MARLLLDQTVLDAYRQLLLTQGIDPHQLLKQVGLNEWGRMRERLISLPAFAKLLFLGGNACQDPLFGLRLSRQPGVWSRDPLTLSCRLQDSLADAFARLNHQGIQLDVCEPIDGYCKVLILDSLGSQREWSYLLQLLAHYLYRLATQASEGEPGCLIHLRQGSASQLSPHVRFLQGFDGISFPASWLSRPLNIEKQEVAAYMDLHLQGVFREPLNVKDQSLMLLRIQLEAGKVVTLESIAKRQQLSERTLQLRLMKAETSYSELLKKVRLELACELLCDAKHSIAEISHQLGFCESSVFCRAFKTWTGVTPSKWARLSKPDAGVLVH